MDISGIYIDGKWEKRECVREKRMGLAIMVMVFL